jgi:hypothetical protein
MSLGMVSVKDVSEHGVFYSGYSGLGDGSANSDYSEYSVIGVLDDETIHLWIPNATNVL